MFQPRVVGILALLGTALSVPSVFLTLGGLLWFSAAFPRRSPFDAMYNATLGKKPGAQPLEPAPAPRRFAQFVGGIFALSIGAALLAGHAGLARGLEAAFLTALAFLNFGGLCFGSYLFHVLRGRIGFANRTLPWTGGQ